MPKGRHLKPDFFTDKNIVSMQPLARLLYEGLWCYAADCGHLDDEPLELKMRILPADNCDVDALLDELAWHKRIERKDGVIYVPKLSDHSRVDKRYETRCDACKEAADHVVTTASKASPKVPNTPGPLSDHDVTTTGSPRDHDADGDGDGDGEVMVKGGRKRPATRLSPDWKPSEKHWEKRHDGIDVEHEAKKFRLHAEANDRRQVNWNASFSQWLMNARPNPSIASAVSTPTPISVTELEKPPSGLTDEEYLQWDYERRQRAGRA